MVEQTLLEATSEIQLEKMQRCRQQRQRSFLSIAMLRRLKHPLSVFSEDSESVFGATDYYIYTFLAECEINLLLPLLWQSVLDSALRIAVSYLLGTTRRLGHLISPDLDKNFCWRSEIAF